MGLEIVIILIIFGVIFGIFYFYILVWNKEWIVFIEKGVDVLIFYSKDRCVMFVWKVIVINFVLLLMGIGIGIFIGVLFIDVLGMDEDIVMLGIILFMVGVGFLIGFFVSKKLNEDV